MRSGQPFLRRAARNPLKRATLEDEQITLSGDVGSAAHKIVEWYDRVMARLDGGDTLD